jgi:hypothetical protein
MRPLRSGLPWIRIAVLVLAGALLLGACGPGPGRTAAGVVIAVDDQAGRVSGFTLRTSGGQTIVFRVGELEVDGAAFPASHLTEHAISLAPIAVAYREVADAKVAYRLVDAPWESAIP